MHKPWLEETDGRRLQAFIGARNIPTRHIETPEELVFFASELFELPEIRTATIAQAVEAVSGMKRKDRRKAAERNRSRLMEEENLDDEPMSEIEQQLGERMH